MRELKTRLLASREKNSLNYWWKAKNPLIICVNFLIIELCKFLPSLSLKRFLLRLLGMKIGRNAAIGLSVQFDIFFPELITLKDNCMLGYNTTILCHEFLQKSLRIGKVIIGENALIATNCLILPGVMVGRNSVVSSMSLVNKDIPANSFYGGIPAKRLKK
jgi:acetyltransferase-like isoleucine patch superfamily enzyme